MLLKFAILHLHNIHTSTPLLNAQWAKRQVLKEITYLMKFYYVNEMK